MTKRARMSDLKRSRRRKRKRNPKKKMSVALPRKRKIQYIVYCRCFL